MNRARYLTAGAVVAGLLASGAAYAQAPRGGGPGRGPGGPGFGAGLALGALNLDESQQQQIKDIRERHRDEIRQAELQVRAAMDAQHKAVETVPVDEGLIRSTTQALAEAQTAAAIVQAHVYSETWAVLNAEQQAQAKKLQAEREARAQQLQQRAGPRRRG